MKEKRIFDYDIEHKKVLEYLYLNRNQINKLSRTAISNYLKYAPSTFNRVVFFLEGAGFVTVIKVGNMCLFQITNTGMKKIKVQKNNKKE